MHTDPLLNRADAYTRVAPQPRLWPAWGVALVALALIALLGWA